MGSAATKPFRTEAFTVGDIWLYACKVMTAAASLEYAYLLRLRKVDSKRTADDDDDDTASKSLDERCTDIDRRAFIVYAAAFLAFTLIYIIVCAIV